MNEFMQSTSKPSSPNPGGRRLIVVQSDHEARILLGARVLRSDNWFLNKTLEPARIGLGMLGLAGRAIKEAASAELPMISRLSLTDAKAYKMPAGHPVIGTVYAVHPCDDNRFYPVASFHSAVFQDKVNEAERLLACLGATRIEIEHVKGWDRNFTANAAAQVNGVDVSAEGGRSSSSSSNLMYEADYDNDDAPFVPDDLHWYPHEQMWQTIVESRFKRGMRSFSLAISNEEDHNINAGLTAKLEKGGFQIGGTFKDHVATTWKMTGTFNNRKPD